jgi:hypothetical protein
MTTATTRLNTALITLASKGDRARCADPITHVMWTSEDQHDRDIAAQWCSGCDVLQLCGAAAEERGEVWAVYGGRDFSIRPGRKKP